MPRVRAPRLSPLVIGLFVTFIAFASSSFAQTPVCSPGATATSVHAEGLAERVGDISVSCTGGAAGSTVSLTIFVSLNTAITNRQDANQTPLGITLTGATSNFRLTSTSTLNFSPLNYTVPATPSTPVVITMSGIRAAVAPVATGTTPAVITASLVGIGATFPSNFSTVVATSFPTLNSSTINNGVPCAGSPLPATLDFPTFAATSTSSTVRVTEASAAAFTIADAGADNGMRLRLSLTGYGSGTRVFAPDAIVGNSGSTPTSGGAFAGSVSAGTYTPASNQLLLIRVTGADSTGTGGTLAMAKPGVVTTFGSMTEITVTGGSSTVTYEVVDSNNGVVESAQIPLFVVVNPTTCPTTLTPQIAVTVAPVSVVNIASTNTADAIPRFVATAPGLDCQQLGDCGAFYFPRLSVDQTAITLSGSSQGNPQSAVVRVGNTGSGILNFTTSVVYQSGSGWLSLSPPSGANNVSVQVIADPTTLAQGTYTATITVSAGLYGTATIPVTFTVGPVGIVITNVGNAANFQYGTVAPGSYAVLFGLNLAGATVTFNSVPATVVFSNATQINLIVPATLGAQQSASVVASGNGLISNSFKVNLLPNSPGLFSQTPGIVNFDDNSLNGPNHPATRGKFVIVYFTGLANPVTGVVTVNIGSQTNLIPAFAGPQGLPALDQVNIIVPTALPGTTSPVPIQVCIPGTTGQQVCSNQVNLYIQ